MDYFVGYLIFGFITFIIGVLITRWIFSVTTFLDYQKKQYLLLRQVATKLGVEPDKIREIDDPIAFDRLKRTRANAELKNKSV